MFIPLDERPCNRDYPLRLFDGNESFKIITPPIELLGYKKRAANIELIKKYVEENIESCDALIYSTEMLAYGGLLPSRIHEIDGNSLLSDYRKFVINIRKNNPKIKIFVSNLIMRTPRYNSSDEEPSYYEKYGENIFKIGWLKDKKERGETDEKSEDELNRLCSVTPRKYVDDFCNRRVKNLEINKTNIDLVNENVLDYLVIPQDDSAPYGFTAMDQKIIYSKIKRFHLQNYISVYPGADESGYTLLARAKQKLLGQQLKIFPIFSGEYGKTVIPLYEDRPLIETFKAHVNSCGAILVHTPEDADFVAAVNIPGKKMIEAFDQRTMPEITYDTYRGLRSFIQEITELSKQNIPISIIDSAYSNGGDLELLSALDRNQLLLKLLSYRAWNTNANTTGSAISTAIVLFESNQEIKSKEVINCITDDVLYQSLVRKKITDSFLGTINQNYFDLGNKAEIVREKAIDLIRNEGLSVLPITWEKKKIEIKSLQFPWNRMFEIKVNVGVKGNG
jgi:hypothetical protein